MTKICTDIEQSKKLIELGLDVNTADMYWWFSDKWCYIATMDDGDFNEEEGNIPAWSLAALLDVLPKNVKSPFGEVNPFVGQVNTKDYRCVYLDGDWDSNIQTFAKNPIDACYEMIIKLNELNLL